MMFKKMISAVVAMMMLAAFAFALAGCNGAEQPNSPASVTPSASHMDSSSAAEVHKHTWAEATCTSPKTCSECGETEGEALGHTLGKATYFAPAACSVCGESVGEPKPDYFTEHGIPVADAPKDYTHKCIIADVNDYSYAISEGFAATVKEYKIEADTKEGYNKVTFVVAVTGEINWEDENGHVGYNTLALGTGLYDVYSGQSFYGADKKGSGSGEYAMTIELDGVSYEITYTDNVKYDWGEWVETEDNATLTVTVTNSYEIHVPEEYDGLVYCAEAITKIEVEEGVQTEETFAGELDNLSECKFFRLNKKS